MPFRSDNLCPSITLANANTTASLNQVPASIVGATGFGGVARNLYFEFYIDTPGALVGIMDWASFLQNCEVTPCAENWWWYGCGLDTAICYEGITGASFFRPGGYGDYDLVPVQAGDCIGFALQVIWDQDNQYYYVTGSIYRNGVLIELPYGFGSLVAENTPTYGRDVRPFAFLNCGSAGVVSLRTGGGFTYPPPEGYEPLDGRAFYHDEAAGIYLPDTAWGGFSHDRWAAEELSLIDLAVLNKIEFARAVFGVSGTIDLLVTKRVVEAIGIHDTLIARATQHLAVLDATGFAQSVFLSFEASAGDAAGLDGSPSFVTSVTRTLRERLGAASRPGMTVWARGVLSDAVGAKDQAVRGFDRVAMSLFGVALELSHLQSAQPNVLDTLGAQEAPGVRMACFAQANSALGTDEEPTSLIAAVQRVEEGVALGLLLRLPEAEYLAWVLNSETLALSEYHHFPFQSFAAHGATYLGATDTGIYELEGADDAGAEIEARIRTGLMELGSARLKALPAVYLGYTASGALGLKVITTEGGRKVETWYRLAQSQGAPATARIRIGKGLRSRYWAVELTNVGGAEFEVDALHLYPVVLSRRL